MLSILLLMLASTQASITEEPTPEAIVAQYRLVMQRWDRDGDARLGLDEIDRMVDTGLRSPQPLPADDEGAFKNAMRDYYRAQDLDRDGFVDMDELQKAGLTVFNCIDADQNGRASIAEMQQGASRCLPM